MPQERLMCPVAVDWTNCTGKHVTSSPATHTEVATTKPGTSGAHRPTPSTRLLVTVAIFRPPCALIRSHVRSQHSFRPPQPHGQISVFRLVRATS
jgi:hypothetical protein